MTYSSKACRVTSCISCFSNAKWALPVAARCTELPACPFIASSKSRLYRGVDHFHGVRSVMMCTASDDNGDHIYILDKCVSGVLFTECSAV